MAHHQPAPARVRYAFAILNVLVLALFSDAIPRRDIVAGVVGFVGVLLAPRCIHDERDITRTKAFTRSFLILSTFEVLVTLLAPWLLILRSLRSRETALINTTGYLLAPHLFVFQTQIVLETFLYHSPILAFWYTCVANAFRVLALYTWVIRALETWDDITTGIANHLIHVLPGFACLLWICSCYFITFIWYPQISTSSGATKKE